MKYYFVESEYSGVDTSLIEGDTYYYRLTIDFVEFMKKVEEKEKLDGSRRLVALEIEGYNIGFVYE